MLGLTYDTSGEADFIQFHMVQEKKKEEPKPVVKVVVKPVDKPAAKPVKVVVKTEPKKAEPVKSKPAKKVEVTKALDSITNKVEGMEIKSHKVATMLALSYTGMFGIDRFYLGYIIWGAIKAITLGGFGIWALIDSIFVSHCWLKDANGRVLKGCTEAESKGIEDVVSDAGKDISGSVDASMDF